MHETLCDILQPIFDTDLEGKIQNHSGECDSFIFSNRTKDLINDLLKLQEEKRLFVSIKIENDRPFYCNTKTDVIGKFKVVITDTIYKDEFCDVRSKAYVLTKPHTHLNGGKREENKPEGKNKNVTKTMETDEIVKCLKWDPNKNNG